MGTIDPSKALVPGSLLDVATGTGTSLVEIAARISEVVLVDTSGSMDAQDSRGGRSRYDVACEELRKVQAAHPGQVAVVSFGSYVRFDPNGIPTFDHGSTAMNRALDFVRSFDGTGVRIILISDGQPDDESAALESARGFTQAIDTIFVGPEEDWAGGRRFLALLSSLHQGVHQVAEFAVDLAPAIHRLINPPKP